MSTRTRVYALVFCWWLFAVSAFGQKVPSNCVWPTSPKPINHEGPFGLSVSVDYGNGSGRPTYFLLTIPPDLSNVTTPAGMKKCSFRINDQELEVEHIRTTPDSIEIGAHVPPVGYDDPLRYRLKFTWDREKGNWVAKELTPLESVPGPVVGAKVPSLPRAGGPIPQNVTYGSLPPHLKKIGLRFTVVPIAIDNTWISGALPYRTDSVELRGGKLVVRAHYRFPAGTTPASLGLTGRKNPAGYVSELTIIFDEEKGDTKGDPIIVEKITTPNGNLVTERAYGAKTRYYENFLPAPRPD